MADKAASAVIVELPQDSTGRLSEEAIVDVARAVTVTSCGIGHGHHPCHADGPIIAALSLRGPNVILRITTSRRSARSAMLLVGAPN